MNNPAPTSNAAASPFAPFHNSGYRTAVNGYTLHVAKSAVHGEGWYGLAYHGYELRHTAFETTGRTRKQVEKELLDWARNRTAPVDVDGISAIRRKLVAVLKGQDAVVAGDPDLTAIMSILDAG